MFTDQNKPQSFSYTQAPKTVGPPHGFAESCATFGLHPLVAISLFGVDQMLGALELASLETLAVVSFFAAFALVPPCALVQKYAFNESWGAAWGKALLLGVLTAIPTALPSVITGAWGIAGAIGLAAKRANQRNGSNTINKDN
jgi:hypothetical protein